MRDHTPVIIENFNGLWDRGDPDSVPADHFVDCNNIDYGDGNFKTRGGLEPILEVPNVLKVYEYKTSTAEGLVLLDVDGNIYDDQSPTPLTPILTIVGMLDFGNVVWADRMYISPSTTVHGMASQYLYVYDFSGNPARLAAGAAPTDADGAMAAANTGGSGNVEVGFRVYAVVYETDSGYLTAPGPDTKPTLLSPGGDTVDLTNIPVSPSTAVIARHIVATKAIIGYNGDDTAYQFFFVPNGEIADNTTTTLTIDFFDSDLIDDASHLLENYAQIPAGVGLAVYNNRLINYTQNADNEQSNALVSESGEPEAFNQIDGIIQLPPDYQPITICAQLRGVLYLFKNIKTFAATDNGGAPSSWPVEIVDAGLGASLHGVATVIETAGGVTAESFIITNFSGCFIFDGKFIRPELSWKIEKRWLDLNFDDFQRVEIYNNTIDKLLFILSPDLELLYVGNYKNSLTPKDIRWGVYTFDIRITSITLRSFTELVLASDQLL